MSHRPEAERESAHERQDPLAEVVSENMEAEPEVEEARKNEDEDRCGSYYTSEIHRLSVDGRWAVDPLFDIVGAALRRSISRPDDGTIPSDNPQGLVSARPRSCVFPPSVATSWWMRRPHVVLWAASRIARPPHKHGFRMRREAAISRAGAVRGGRTCIGRS